MRKCLKIVLLLASLLNLSSCLVSSEDPEATFSNLLVSKGDIAVASVTNDSVIIFSPEGVFKRVLYQLPLLSDTIMGMTWNSTTNELLITVDGSPDRIVAISILDGSARNFYANLSYFTGTAQAIAQLGGGDIIAAEGATIERFNSSGTREVHTTIWPTNVHANTMQINTLADGNFLSCSSTAGLRVTPDSITDLTAVSTAVGPVGATASYGCAELSTGEIVVGWNGAAADHIYLYTDSTLATSTAIISTNAAVLSDPRNIAIGENDEIYIADGTRNMIVQIDDAGDVVREFGNTVLAAPRYLTVIPAFTP